MTYPSVGRINGQTTFRQVAEDVLFVGNETNGSDIVFAIESATNTTTGSEVTVSVENVIVNGTGFTPTLDIVVDVAGQADAVDNLELSPGQREVYTFTYTTGGEVTAHLNREFASGSLTLTAQTTDDGNGGNGGTDGGMNTVFVVGAAALIAYVIYSMSS